jgi:hypothetical protein
MQTRKLVFVFLISLTSLLVAQSSYQVSISPGLYKSKDTKGFSIDGVGINAAIMRSITERLSLSFSAGYFDFPKNNGYDNIMVFVPSPFAPSPREEYDYLIPFRFAGKYFVGNSNFNPYLTVEWALNYLSRDIYSYSNYTERKLNDKAFHPSFGIGMGAILKISENFSADIMFVGHLGKIINQFILFQGGLSYTL